MGSDHAGYDLKVVLAEHLVGAGHEVTDLGTGNDRDSVDYPAFGAAVGRAVVAGQADLGVCVCGTGIGISIAANKVRGIRAALVTDEYGARMAREHNDSNVLALRGREFDPEEARRLMTIWLDTPFGEGPRHARRIEKIKAIEEAQ